MNGVTITTMQGDYGTGETRERRERTRRPGSHYGPNGDKWHASLSVEQINKAMNDWSRRLW